MLLSKEQIEDLTGRSRYRPSLQIKALEAMGIRHWVRPDGKPVVDSSALEGETPTTSNEPDFGAIGI